MTQPPLTYFDAASSEPLHPAAAEVFQRALEAGYADPRRLHGPSRNAALLLENARAVVAECLGVRPDEVTFTPSGTHAVHLGILGLLRSGDTKGWKLIAGATEHSSVLHAGRWHEAHGGSFATVPVDSNGRVALDALSEMAMSGRPAPDVLALQSANHEVGTLQPIDEVVARFGAFPLFMDACASAGRLPLPKGWTTAAASAHKWGGPAGVGVLLVRKNAKWRAPFPLDDRADVRATGMENVPAVLAAAAALQVVCAERDEVNSRQARLIDRIRSSVSQLPDTEVVGDPVQRLPHVVTCSFLYVDGEALVTELDRRGFAVASGSACTASALTPSHVLAAMGALTHGNIRISLLRDAREDDVDRLLAVLPELVARLRADAGIR